MLLKDISYREIIFHIIVHKFLSHELYSLKFTIFIDSGFVLLSYGVLNRCISWTHQNFRIPLRIVCSPTIKFSLNYITHFYRVALVNVVIMKIFVNIIMENHAMIRVKFLTYPFDFFQIAQPSTGLLKNIGEQDINLMFPNNLTYLQSLLWIQAINSFDFTLYPCSSYSLKNITPELFFNTFHLFRKWCPTATYVAF